jgi:hypothetical protein
MTTRKTRNRVSETSKLFQDDNQLTSPVEKKRVRPPKTGKVFLGQEQMRELNAYRKYLKEVQNITQIKHKPI